MRITGDYCLVFYIEHILIDNYCQKPIRTKDDIKAHINFAKQNCIDNNIEILWYRPNECNNIIFPSPSSNPFKRLIAEYCNSYLIYE